MDEIFPGRWRQYQRRPDSFAELQVKFARIAGEAAVDRGEYLVECLQGAQPAYERYACYLWLPQLNLSLLGSITFRQGNILPI